jgi:imidazolonepropionase-like amidohydrolase
MSARITTLALLSLLTGSPSCREPVATAVPGEIVPATTPVAFVGVHVIPMDADRVLRDQVVLVRDGHIERVGPVGTVVVPTDAAIVQGGGRYLMPALIDMHVHLWRKDMNAYVANGIGTVRNMWGTETARTLRSEVESGALRGPTIYSVSPGVDGTPPQWPGTQLVTAPESASRVVGALATQGWIGIKVYSQLTATAFDSVMASARSLGLQAEGHVPLRVDVRHALSEGLRSIEHFTGYDRAVSRTSRVGTWGWSDADSTRYASLVAATVAAGAWNCPTLSIYIKLAEQQHPADERVRIAANRRAFTRALSRAGARLLLGTDSGIDVVAPGTSLHDELREFVAAGLTPYEALRAATSDAAAFLGRQDLGRVVNGAQADLLLLNGDPLRDVSNAKKIAGIMLRGAWQPAPLPQ